MRRSKPATNEIYHIYNRGVEKRDTFLNNEDRLRFVHDLFEFNDRAPALSLNYYLGRLTSKSIEVGLPKIKRRPRKLLVELLAFCLMPNHFHLMVRQKTEGGVTTFMRKLGTGYTNYFNQKYQRAGVLFQGKYKLVRLTSEAHFLYLPHYIHLNPLDLVAPEWREGKLKNPRKAVTFLEQYRWSSFLDYIGKRNFSSVTQREFLSKFFEEPMGCKKATFHWLRSVGAKRIAEIALE